MDKTLLLRLDKIVSAITRGDYSCGNDMDRLLTGEDCQREELQFLESLGLMSVKLEARELALDEAIEDLKHKNSALVLAKRKNRLFSTIFVSLFLAISLYIFLIFLAMSLNYASGYSARIVEAIFAAACIIIVWKSGFSFSELGVTFRGAADSIRYMLPGTLLICIVLIALKYLFISGGVTGLNGGLFILDNINLLFLLYIPVAALQEFLARGVIQTAIEFVLEGRHATFLAILTASALFGLVHIQLSVGVALASFVCGLYWGYLYHKKKCLVGVVLSHFIIGDMAYILGFWDYLFKV